MMQCYIHEVIEYENETAKNSSLKQRMPRITGLAVARFAHDALALHLENALRVCTAPSPVLSENPP